MTRKPEYSDEQCTAMRENLRAALAGHIPSFKSDELVTRVSDTTAHLLTYTSRAMPETTIDEVYRACELRNHLEKLQRLGFDLSGILSQISQAMFLAQINIDPEPDVEEEQS